MVREQVNGHLPLANDSIVGRRQDMADVRALIAAQRLVTLTGTAGVGKTRMCLEVTWAVRRTFRDGVWFVDLSSLRAPQLVHRVVLDTLGVRDSSARDPSLLLAEHLQERQALIVLDNCEHVLLETSRLVRSLLPKAPGVRVLATSRQPLGLAGETVYRLRPLSVPDAAAQDGQDVLEYAAIELFARRAATALEGFRVGPANRQEVVEICQSLEGLPLALELAASRLKVMSVTELLSRLDDRFALLKDLTPLGDTRHQTLTAAMKWSYGLCSPVERLLWQRASVFAGTFDLGAVEEVCAGGELSVDQVVDALGGLVDKSILMNEQQEGDVRFRMLETIREFGLAQLRASASETAVRRAHCDWVSKLLDEANREWFGPRQVEWYSRLRTNQSNIRAAIDYCTRQLECGQQGLTMAGESWFLWIGCGFLAEGRLWLEGLLDKYPDRTAVRATALATTAFVAAIQGDGTRGITAADEALALAKSLGDEMRIAYAIHMRALCAFVCDDHQQAEPLYLLARERYDALGAPESISLSLLVQYATMKALQGDVTVTEELFTIIESRAREAGEQWLLSYAFWGLGLVNFMRGEFDRAEEMVLRSIAVKQRFHDTPGLSLAFDVLAWTQAEKGAATDAATLIGAASRIWATVGIDLFGSMHFSGPRIRCETIARAALGDTAFDAARALGASNTLDDTLASLLHEHKPEKARPRGRSGPLTKREQEVAELIAGGLSNQEIADRLVISVRTAHGHVENILRKMGFRSRTQVATWVVSVSGDLAEND